jgi:serine/threonine-protein kinase
MCPACHKEYADDVPLCPLDGKLLLRKEIASSEIENLTGRLIDNKYRIQEKIAKGGTGAVYHGLHIALNMPVAIKIMHTTKSRDVTSIERFRREAYAAIEIRHPNAIGVMDFGVTNDGLVYVVMEHLNGNTLRQKLKQERYLPLTEVNEIMQQICAAVAVAHQYKIIHRDLKPENIFVHQVNNWEIVKVLDFGIAKFKGAIGADGGEEMNLTRQGVVIGTPYYMSPEQCYGKEIDTRSDIYSLGIMLYEMLAGQRPFSGRSASMVAVKHVTEEPKPIYDIRPNIPAMLNGVVMHALRKKPEERPSDVLIFAEELNAAMKAVTESEFQRVFSQASEQDIEAAVLLTTDPAKLAEKVHHRRRNITQELNSNVQMSATFSAAPPVFTDPLGSDPANLPTEVNLLITETGVGVGIDAGTLVTDLQQTINEGHIDEQETLSATALVLTETTKQSYRDNFQQVAKETVMLLQIILNDLTEQVVVDSLFLNELKKSVDQLQAGIQWLQQTDRR